MTLTTLVLSAMSGEPFLISQLVAALSWGIFWHYLMDALLNNVFRPRLRKKHTHDQVVYIGRKTTPKEFSQGWNDDHFLNWHCFGKCIAVQHTTGALLSLPAFFGAFVSPAMATTLAVQGALCELGWEIEDTLKTAYVLTFGTEKERTQRAAPGFLFFM